MIEYVNSALYNQSSVDKQLHITYDSTDIGNEDLHSEEFSLSESLCSESELRFGSCESSVVKFRVSNMVSSLKGKTITITETLNGDTENPFQFGIYKVDSDKPTADRSWRDIVAYDAMYDIINAEVSTWYNGLTFPMTVKQFRDSFFTHLGITQETVTLVNDSVSIAKTITTSELSGKTVITAICELNGVFGHINRSGNFTYIALDGIISTLYPSNDLYPSDTLFPASGNTELISKSRYSSCQYEDFKTSKITQLTIRQEDDDVGATIGNVGNTYIIEGNFLTYGMNSTLLNTVGTNILNTINCVSYRPQETETNGNPCIEVGDKIRMHTTQEVVESYVLQRTIKGIQGLLDTYSADGVETYSSNVNSVQRSIQQLRGKTVKLETDADGIRASVEDLATDTTAALEVLEGQISLKVTRGQVNSMINVAIDGIQISASQISLEGYTTINGGFSIDTSGNAHLKYASNEVEMSSLGMEVKNGSASAIYSYNIIILSDNSGTNRTLAQYSDNGYIALGDSATRITCSTLNGSTPITSGNIASDETITALETRISALESKLSGSSWSTYQLEEYSTGDEVELTVLSK